MSEGILGVATINSIAESSSKGKEHSLDRLFHAGRVSGGNSMKSWSHTGTAVTTIAGTASSIALDEVAPMRSKNDGTFRSDNGSTVHAEFVEMIELFPFTSLPKWPCGQCLELAASEVAKSVFSRCSSL